MHLHLWAVFRAIAAIVACAMLATSGSAAFAHVHEYAGHRHAEHQHGVASHTHAPPASSAVADASDHADHDPRPDLPTAGARLEGCEPGAHAVSITSPGVAPPPDHWMACVAVAAIVVAPPACAGGRLLRLHVRVHSPPRITDAPLRAPPSLHLA